MTNMMGKFNKVVEGFLNIIRYHFQGHLKMVRSIINK